MTDEARSPLRRRMIEDMTIRKFAAKTQHDYVQRVKISQPSSDDRRIWPASRMCAAISSIWHRAASACRPSTRRSRPCGSYSRSGCGAGPENIDTILDLLIDGARGLWRPICGRLQDLPKPEVRSKT
jgi:hypothetical protein